MKTTHPTWTIVKVSALAAVLSAYSLPVLAGENLWSSAGGQGVYEYRASNLSGDTLAINNGASAELDRAEPCWLSLETSKIRLPKTIQISIRVGRQVSIFNLASGETNFSTKTEREQLFSLVNALTSTKASSFRVEIPSLHTSVILPTANAKEALTDALDGCS